MITPATLVVQNIPPEAVHIVDSLFVMVVGVTGIFALGVPLIRAWIRRSERSAQLPAPPSAEITTRLERIEQAVEAVAIEVERIAEAQRFSAKLMAEQQKILQNSLPRADSPSS
jgi:hypothetical protein